MRKTIHEVFEAVANAPTRKEKVAVLVANKTPSLINILKAAFDESYEWDLPKGYPPVPKQDRTIPIGFAPANLHSEARLLYLFDKKCTKIKNVKKEMLFIGLLEGLHYTEADMLIAVKDNTLNKRYNGLTATVARDAFPAEIHIK